MGAYFTFMVWLWSLSVNNIPPSSIFHFGYLNVIKSTPIFSNVVLVFGYIAKFYFKYFFIGNELRS